LAAGFCPNKLAFARKIFAFPHSRGGARRGGAAAPNLPSARALMNPTPTRLTIRICHRLRQHANSPIVNGPTVNA